MFITRGRGETIRSKCFFCPPPFFNLETAVGTSNNCRLAVGDFSGDLGYRGNGSGPFLCKCFSFQSPDLSASLSLQPPYFPSFYGSSEGQFVCWALVLFVGAWRRVGEDVKWNPLITAQAIRDNCEGRVRKTLREGDWVSGARRGKRVRGVKGEQTK